MSSKHDRPSCSTLEASLAHFNAVDEPEIYLRKRIRDPSPDDELEAGDLSDALSDDEDVPGCPLPSTPEDNELLEAEVSNCCIITGFIIKLNPVSKLNFLSTT